MGELLARGAADDGSALRRDDVEIETPCAHELEHHVGAAHCGQPTVSTASGLKLAGSSRLPSTRAALAAAGGGGRDKGEVEQALLNKALTDYPHLFTADRLWIMDRNFPGVPRIQRMRAAGTHVLIRVKDGITLRRIGDFLPQGSYLARMSDGGIALTVRVTGYTVSVAGRDAPSCSA